MSLETALITACGVLASVVASLATVISYLWKQSRAQDREHDAAMDAARGECERGKSDLATAIEARWESAKNALVAVYEQRIADLQEQIARERALGDEARRANAEWDEALRGKARAKLANGATS